MFPSPHKAGFTLLELLLVLVIVVALALFVLPSISGSRDRRSVETQARSALGLARKARALASGEGRVYLLVVDRAQREMRLARRRESIAEATNDEDPELELAPEGSRWESRVAFEDAVELESATRDGEPLDAEGETIQISFKPMGEAEDVELVFGAGGSRVAVRVDRYLGLARVEELEE